MDSKISGNIIQNLINLDLNYKEEDLLRFNCTEKYSREDIVNYSTSTGIVFPDFYVDFLINVGACELFTRYDNRNWGGRNIIEVTEFMRLRDIIDYNEAVWPDLIDNITEFVVIGMNSWRDTYLGIDLKRESNNFGIFTSDSYPEEWHLETDCWYNFEDWLALLVEGNGKIPR